MTVARTINSTRYAPKRNPKPKSDPEPCTSTRLASKKDNNLITAGVAPKGRQIVSDQSAQDPHPPEPTVNTEASDTPSGGRRGGCTTRPSPHRGASGHGSTRGRGKGKTPAAKGIGGTPESKSSNNTDSEENPKSTDEAEVPPTSSNTVVCFDSSPMFMSIYLPLSELQRGPHTVPDLAQLHKALTKTKQSLRLETNTGSQGSGMLSFIYCTGTY